MSVRQDLATGGAGVQIANFVDNCTLFLTTAHFTTAHFSLDNCTFLADYCTICVQLHAIANPGVQGPYVVTKTC